MVHSDSSGLNCTTYDLTGAITDKKNSCVGIGMPTGMNNNNSDENLAMEPVIVEDEKLSKFSEEFQIDELVPKINAFVQLFSLRRRTSPVVLPKNQFQRDLRSQRWQ